MTLAGLCLAGLAAQDSVPHRVVDAAAGRLSDVSAMLADVSKADVVFLGEQHDDPETHRMELAILEGLARGSRPVVLALEMFERDAQEPLEHFLMGHLGEAEFLAAARPWPRYATDYKPLVDVAIAREWPVVAANAPRPMVAEVARDGLDVLAAKSPPQRALVARELHCPAGDAYFKRFEAAMAADHPPAEPAAGGAPSVERAYLAQCLRDETMAESIAQALTTPAAGGARPLVVSVNGAFHSDFRQGVVERTRRRVPDARLLVITIVPVDSLDTVKPESGDAERADYVLYVTRWPRSE